MAYVDFYHYTSEAAADAIIESEVIYESSNGGPDAFFGQGVYGTALPPSAGKRRIASNNWQRGWKTRERGGHVDYYILVKLPRHKVKEFTSGTGRHIYLHPGPINLSQYEWECLEVS